MTAGTADIPVTVVRRRDIARRIAEFTLARPDGAPLPGFGSGAHIDVTTPVGLRRSYSLCEPGRTAPAEYVIAVDRRDDGDGGSLSMHRDATTGSTVTVSVPDGSFSGGTDPAGTVLIAGGVGITAVRGKFLELRDAGKPVELVYLAHERDRAGYLDELEGIPDGLVHISSEHGAQHCDLWPVLADPGDRELYCCGPQGLMDEVRDLTVHWRPSLLHFEDFAGVSVVDPFAEEFTAVWAPTGQEIQVPADVPLLDALETSGVSVPSSCRSGTCGTCRVSVTGGEVRHRDVVLSDREREDHMVPCVSRGSGRIILDVSQIRSS